ncbi:MAG: N-acetylmuramoyl-L-alanine amidase [Novosphingobium sp. 12-63-9]|nr:MAG: N-acetylmuramoyl-L-alanine amidase [Novosphingobium sp. 12-63-9]
MNRRATFGRILIAAGFLVPLAILALWARTVLSGEGDRGYVLRLALPDGSQQIGLPPVLGPGDASRPLVVIDAGHGGHDPGASGQGGEKEKTATLALALALRDALLEGGQVRVAMTRETDRFLVLEERSGIAQRLHADLFVSIHADAAENTDAGGATVYTLSDRGSDAVADQLASRENRADTVNGVTLGGKSDAVSSILVDLSRREMRARSQAFGALILREGEGKLRFHPDPQRQAAFIVLKSLDLPSVLVEAGYISNEADSRAMNDKAWRAAFAGALANAIRITLARQDAAPLAP